MHSKTLAHAIILCGDDDLGDISIEIAKSFTCISQKPPCNQCKFCQKTEKGVNPDIIFLDFGDKNISVEEIRKIRKDAYILPNECEKKVYIIKNGHNLSAISQNALLKILEEPPKYACFIIECKNEKNLLNTIISRCSIYRFVSKTQEIDPEIYEKTLYIVRAITKNDEISLLDTKIKEKIQLLNVITLIKVFLRDSIILNENDCIDFETCKNLNYAKNTAQLYKIYDILTKIESLCEYNVSVSNIMYYFATELYKK